MLENACYFTMICSSLDYYGLMLGIYKTSRAHSLGVSLVYIVFIGEQKNPSFSMYGQVYSHCKCTIIANSLHFGQ